MNSIKKYKYLVILLFISCAVYWRWFTFGTFVWEDKGFYTSELAKSLISPSSWITHSSLAGHPNIDLWRAPQQLLIGLFGYFGFGSNVLDFFVYFIPIIFFLPTISYFLIKKISGNEKGAFIGSLVVCFNSYFLSIDKVGHLGLTISATYGLATILFFICLIEKKEKRTARYIVLSVFALFLCSTYDLRFAYLTIIVLGILGLGYGLLALTTHKRWILGLIIICIAYVGLSTYWILPAMVSSSITNSDVLGRQLVFSNLWSIASPILLHHPFWDGSDSWFKPQPPAFFFYIFPLLAVLGVIISKGKYKKLAIIYLLLSLLGVFLSKQLSEPFGNIYKVLYEHFPGFSAFREATKFYFFIIIGYGVLTGITIKSLIDTKVKNVRPLYINILFAILTALLLIVPMYISFGFTNSLYHSNPPSAENIEMNDYMKEIGDETYSRTLMVPSNNVWTQGTTNHPIYDLTSAQEKQWYNTIKYVRDPSEPFSGILTQSYSQYLLSIYGYDRLIVPPTSNQTVKNDISIYFNKDRKHYIDLLNQSSYLSHETSNKSFSVYRNKEANKFPYVRATNNIVYANGIEEAAEKNNLLQDITSNQVSANYISSDETQGYGEIELSKVFEDISDENIFEGYFEKVVKLDSPNRLITRKDLHAVNLNQDENKILINSIKKGIDGATNENDSERAYTDLKPGVYTIRINNQNIGRGIDGTFKDGPWTSTVQDCRNYDDKPEIGMNLLTIDSQKVIELSAKKHNACTSTSRTVLEGNEYALNMQYRSNTNSKSGYYIEFNDSNKSVITMSLASSSNWQTYHRSFVAPKGATQARVYLYAYESENSNKTNINQYKNISLVNLPDEAMDIWTSANLKDLNTEIPSVSYKIDSETDKNITINNIKRPFTLIINEEYADGWKVNDPSSKHTLFDINKENPQGVISHYKINGYANAWVIDPSKYCSSRSCEQKPDGTYTINMTIEYEPQKWLNLGVGISIFSAVIGLLSVLVINRYKK